MINGIKALLRRFTPDKELEDRIRRNREALERKRVESRPPVPALDTVQQVENVLQ